MSIRASYSVENVHVLHYSIPVSNHLLDKPFKLLRYLSLYKARVTLKKTKTKRRAVKSINVSPVQLGEFKPSRLSGRSGKHFP